MVVTIEVCKDRKLWSCSICWVFALYKGYTRCCTLSVHHFVSKGQL